MNQYFKQFPTIEYKNKNAVDITRRIKSIDSIANNPFIFYPYTLSEYERLDNVANEFFDDPYAGWVLSLTNTIIDPYYDWYMNTKEFNDFIVKKYGSIQKASEKIVGYRNNWFRFSEDKITVAQRNALSYKEYRYWEPIVQGNKVLFYKRKQLDEVVNTNIILKISIINPDVNNDLPISIGDVINLTYLQNNITGTVVSFMNDIVYIQHISNYSDTFDPNNIDYVIIDGQNLVVSDVEIYHQNIAMIDIKYFDPFTAYDMEAEKNEYNKTIKVLNPSLVPQFIENAKQSLK